MVKKSSKRKAERRAKRVRFAQAIPNVGKQSNEMIPASAAINQRIEELDGKILLTFQHYKKNSCEISSLNERNAKKLVDQLRQLTSISMKQLPNSKLIRDKVERSKSSSFLYKNLPPDVDFRDRLWGKGANFRFYG